MNDTSTERQRQIVELLRRQPALTICELVENLEAPTRLVHTILRLWSRRAWWSGLTTAWPCHRSPRHRPGGGALPRYAAAGAPAGILRNYQQVRWHHPGSLCTLRPAIAGPPALPTWHLRVTSFQSG